MATNLMAGLVSVSTAWTQNPSLRSPTDTPAQQSATPRPSADLNGLLLRNHLVLDSIERDYPPSAAPAYAEHLTTDGESIIDPLATRTASPGSSVADSSERCYESSQIDHNDTEKFEPSLHSGSNTVVQSCIEEPQCVTSAAAPVDCPTMPHETEINSVRNSTTRLSLSNGNPYSRVLALLSGEPHVDLRMSFADTQLKNSTAIPMEVPEPAKDSWKARQGRRFRILGGKSIKSRSWSPPASKSSPSGPALRVTTDEAVSEEPQDESAYVTGLKLAMLLFALSFAVFTVAMDVNIIATAIPHITKDFKSLGDVGWYGSAYLMTICAFQVVFGRIYTFFRTKTVFMISIGIFELGSLIAAVSPNSELFIAGRAIQGTGTSGIISGALIIISQVVPLRRRPMLVGMIGSMEGVAMVSAPLLGGALTERLSWRWCFYINLPIGAFVLAVVLFYLKPPRVQANEATTWRQKARQLDLVGTVVLIPAIVSLLLAFQLGGTKYPWNSLGIVMLFLMGFVLLFIFAYFQWLKKDYATIPPRILRKRSILAGALFSFCISSGLTVISYFLPLWFQAIKGASSSRSGIMILALLLGVIAAVVVCGALVSAIGYYTPFMIASSIFMSVGAGLMSTFEVDTGPPRWIAYQILFGIGVGLGFQQPVIAAQTVLKDKDIPIGTSIMVFAQTFGGALMLSVGQTVFSNRLVAEFDAEGLPRTSLLNADPTDLEDLAGPDLVDIVLRGYNNAICGTFYVALAMATLSVVGALAMEWKSVKSQEKVKVKEKEQPTA